jgi:hypothetical protein
MNNKLLFRNQLTNQNADIKDNDLSGQDIIVAGGHSLNYRFSNNAGTISDNKANQIIIDQATLTDVHQGLIHLENNTVANPATF